MAKRTKLDHSKYLAGQWWQERRREYLITHDKCEECQVPRWLASAVYDQDLHVHHLSYANLNAEEDSDLATLCRRCHDVEHYGRSEFKELKSAKCSVFGEKHFNPYSDFCVICDVLVAHNTIKWTISDPKRQWPLWIYAISDIMIEIHDKGQTLDLLEQWFAALLQVNKEKHERNNTEVEIPF